MSHLYRHLGFSVPDYNYRLPVEPQEAIEEAQEPRQKVLVGTGFEEKRIDLGESKPRIKLRWPLLTKEQADDLFSFYLAVEKTKTFRWMHPTDGLFYVVRFVEGLKRVVEVGKVYSVETVELEIVKAIVSEGFGHGKYSHNKYGEG